MGQALSRKEKKMKRIRLFLATVSLIAMTSCGAVSDKEPVKEVGIMREYTSQVEGEEPETESAEAEEKHSWVEEKIVPLIGGLGLTNIGSLLAGIVILIAKNKSSKKRNEKNDQDIEAQVAKITALENKVVELENSVSKYKEFTSAMFEGYKEDFEKTSANMKSIVEHSDKMIVLVEKQNAKIEDVARLKDAIQISCDLTAKSFALSETAVKSGIAEDAQKLVKTLKGGNSDEKEK